jgi:hypothetical protein
MLESARPVTDLIVAVDTGSTDDTIDCINRFGKENSIPTFVFERAFDNFSGSRNYALAKLLNEVTRLGWSTNETWGFWIDCDEVMVIADSFNRDLITEDIYCVSTYIDKIAYAKTCFFRLNRGFFWEGPIHETLSSNAPSISSGLLKGIHILYTLEGASWQNDREQKYLSYATILEQFISEGNNFFRWKYFAGESYFSASDYSRSEADKTSHQEKALCFYQEALSLAKDDFEKAMAHRKIAYTKKALYHPFIEIQDHYLHTYRFDKTHGEPLSEIISYYMWQEDWPLAYVFSKFAATKFHNREPFNTSYVMVDESLYRWKFLYYYYLSAYHCGKASEARTSYTELKGVIETRPHFLERHDIKSIKMTAPSLLNIRNKIKLIKDVLVK